MWPLDEPHHVEHRAQELLGLDEWIAARLFTPVVLTVPYREVTPGQMATVLWAFAGGAKPEAAWVAVGLADMREYLDAEEQQRAQEVRA